MFFTWLRAAAVALLVFVAVFAVRFATVGPGRSTLGSPDVLQQQSGSFEMARKNYASAKQVTQPSAAPIESQKYEKIGSLAQVSGAFDADRKRTFDLIASNDGLVQQERAVGQKGSRVLQLGIGVPPEKFDAFIEAAREIGTGISIDIVKNDKTNEYLQLRARRETLDKARTALEDLRASGGSLDERVTVQNRLTEIEQQIQDLGVSLGEFDTQNELCTVKLSLREKLDLPPWSVGKRAYQALQLALTDYCKLGLGFLGLMAGFWVAVIAIRQARQLLRQTAA